MRRCLQVAAAAAAAGAAAASDGAASGPCVSLTINATSAASTFGPHYASWNIDPSRDRAFFETAIFGTAQEVQIDREGRCSIYEVRPMICRSHGMPVSWKADDALQSGDLQGVESRDVCPLNFDGVDLSVLPKTDVLSLDKLNIVLSLINRKFDEEKSGMRFSVEELIPR